jgi:hypothetical protein
MKSFGDETALRDPAPQNHDIPVGRRVPAEVLCETSHHPPLAPVAPAPQSQISQHGAVDKSEQSQDQGVRSVHGSISPQLEQISAVAKPRFVTPRL